jgi:hypothetical protein
MIRMVAAVWSFVRPDLWADAFLSGFRGYRRWRGGHWERWWVDCCQSEVWIRLRPSELPCHASRGTRPGCCFGSPVCEDYGGEMRVEAPR